MSDFVLRSGLIGAGLFALTACATLSAGAPAATADSETVVGDYLKGRFAARQRALGDAATAFSDAAEASGQERLTSQAFQYALATGRKDDALRYADEVLRQGVPEELGAYDFTEADLPRLTLAAGALEDGDEDEAMRLLEEPFATGVGRALGFLLEGWTLYARNGLEAATTHLQSRPEDTFIGFVPLHLALMFDMSGDPENAETAFAAAIQTPAADTALIGFAGLLEREGKTDEAARLYHRMSEDRGYLRRVGRMGLARLGEPIKGESSDFIRLAKQAPKRLATEPNEGAAIVFLNFAWGAYEQAIAEQEAAARAGFGDMALYLNVPLSFAQLSLLLDDERNAAHYIVGAITAAYDQPALSAAALDQVEETSWLYNYAVIDRADALLDLGREDEAISLLTDYAKQDALAPDVYLRLADLYASDDRWDQSARAATEAIRIVETLSSDDTRAQNLWRYRFARGVGYVDAGDWPKGEEDLQAALTLAPDEPLVLNYLGYSYVERGERLEEALSMIERALELEPNSGAITDSLGWAHYQLGNYEQAVEYLERAVELEPGDDVITDHLGDAYWQLGRHKEASFEWRRVLEIEELTPELRNTVRGKLTGDAPAPGALAHLDRDV